MFHLIAKIIGGFFGLVFGLIGGLIGLVAGAIGLAVGLGAIVLVGGLLLIPLALLLVLIF